MHNLQETIIKRYHATYPSDTLKEISQKTGIQVTRVFRLFNGSEMKISEYEIFESVLVENLKHQEFQNLTKNCFTTLSPNKLNYLTAFMLQSIKAVQMSSRSITPITETELAL